MDCVNENYLVTQGNDLIEARHKKPLTAREQKIILTMVSMIEPADKDFKDYVISIKEFHEMLGLEGREHYTEMKKVIESLMSKVVEIPLEDKSWLMTHWVSTAKYLDGSGAIQLRFAPELKPYLLQLKTAFTSYKLTNILSLKSVYAIRLYELMKKWQLITKWECSIESLREKLGASNKSYNVYGNFKNKILAPSINELNEQTDLHIQYKEIKKGRKVTGIEFIIKQNPGNKGIKVPRLESAQSKGEIEEMRSRLNAIVDGYQLDSAFFQALHQDAYKVWQDQTEKELAYLINYINGETSIKSPLGFIRSKIKTVIEALERGEHLSFAGLELNKGRSPVREEVLPDWLTIPDEEPEAIKEVDPDLQAELQAEKENILKNLAKKRAASKQ